MMKNADMSIVREYEKYLYAEEKSKATVEKYMRDIRKFAEWIRVSNLGSVTKENILLYKEIKVCTEEQALLYFKYNMCNGNQD